MLGNGKVTLTAWVKLIALLAVENIFLINVRLDTPLIGVLY
jgi:hypothetical protein